MLMFPNPTKRDHDIGDVRKIQARSPKMLRNAKKLHTVEKRMTPSSER